MNTALVGMTQNGVPCVFYLGQREYGDVNCLSWRDNRWQNAGVTSPKWPDRMDGTALAVVLTPDSSLHLYYQGNDRHIHEVEWSGDGNLHRDVTADAGGPPGIGRTPLAATHVDGGARVLFVADDGKLHELAWSANRWHHRGVVTTEFGEVLLR